MAYFTFALNWFWGKDEVAGYHVVNIVIHILAAFFLFLTIRQLLKTPNITIGLRENAFFIALLTSTLWAIHPIQTQAVTYIVQRMTSLAALFYIIAIWAYISGRLALIFQKRMAWFAGCLLAWFLALLTKQNTVILPVVLILIEFCFFQNWNKLIVKRFYWGLIIFGLLIVTGVIVFFLIGGDAGPFMEKYKIRPFTPMERLLTQFRVLIFYLGQIVYPIPAKFSITHDFVISRSFFAPWTTLPCILMVLGMISTAVWAISKGPFLKIAGFAILFFFVNQLIESTILPLEMVFEHRNYLPLFFLFLPVSIGINNAIHFYQRQSRLIFYFLVFSTCTLLINLGISTFSRNMDWKSEKTLWQDAMVKAPKAARPPHNLAWAHYAPAGQLDIAIGLYHRALGLQDESIGFESTVYFNLAVLYYSQLGDYEKTIQYCLQTLQINPNHVHAFNLMADSLARLGRYHEALEVIENSVSNVARNPANMHLTGLILLNTYKPEAALILFQQCLVLDPDNWLYLREIGFTYLMMDLHNRADWFFRRANTLYPHQPEILLGIAATKLEKGFFQESEAFIERFILALGAEKVENYWSNAINNPLNLPIPYQRLKPLISGQLIKKNKFLFRYIPPIFSDYG
jgi:protein O-mannosyl-transferase